MAVDYAVGQSFIEGFMIDSCTIVRDTMDQYDDVLNETTGVLGTQTAGPGTVYSGKCLVKDPRSATKPQEIGGSPADVEVFKILIPHDAPRVRLNDIVTLTVSHDPVLAGSVFRIKDIAKGTHRVYRAVYAEDITNAR